MKSIFKYLGNYKKETFLAPLFKMLEASFELIVPLVVARLVDVGIKNEDKTCIVQMTGLLVLLAVFGLAFASCAQFFAAKAAAGFGRELRSDLFSHIMNLSLHVKDREGTSTLINRMTTDVNLVQSQVNMVIRLFLRSPFIVFGAMLMAFFVDVRAGLIFLVTIPVLSVIIFGLMKITIPLYREVQKRLDKVTLRTRENLNGARVIRAFGLELDETEKFIDENESLKKIQLFSGRISSIMSPATFIVVNAATIAILIFGGKEVFAGGLTRGMVIALVNYMSQILVELIKLANLIVNVTRALASKSRIEAVMALESDMKDGDIDEIEADNEIAVSFKDVSMSYSDEGDEALTDINFEIKKGMTVGIIGGTGSGKSTLISLIMRLYDADSGEVSVFGRDVKEYKENTLRSVISIAPQKAKLFKGSVRSNLKWGDENAQDEELIKALKATQSYDFVMDKGGLECEVAEGGSNFSGGQKQRLSLARALVKKPKILILDDTTSALDYLTESRVLSELSKLYDMTKIIVSQRSGSISSSDFILVLDDGMLVGSGKHDDLLKSCDVYREIYQSKFAGDSDT